MRVIASEFGLLLGQSELVELHGLLIVAGLGTYLRYAAQQVDEVMRVAVGSALGRRQRVASVLFRAAVVARRYSLFEFLIGQEQRDRLRQTEAGRQQQPRAGEPFNAIARKRAAPARLGRGVVAVVAHALLQCNTRTKPGAALEIVPGSSTAPSVSGCDLNNCTARADNSQAFQDHRGKSAPRPSEVFFSLKSRADPPARNQPDGA